MFSTLVAVVIIIAFGAILVPIVTRKKSGGGAGKQKSRGQIIKECNRKLSVDPHNPEGLIPLGDLYFQEHNWEKAYQIYDTMLNIAAVHKEIDPFLSALRQGICAYKLNKTEDAFRGLITAYKLQSDNYDANYYLGLNCYANKDYEKAVPCLRKALVIKPDATAINAKLGLALYNGKHFRECLAFLHRALDEQPDNKEALFSMADAMDECGYGEKAMKVFMHLRPDPEFGARSCLAAGKNHAKTGQYDKAIQDFEIGLKHENIPVDIMLELRYHMANACFAVKDISTGIACLKEIQVVNPQYKDVGQLMGRYQELNQNRNLQIYLMSATSDFVALCRKVTASYYANSYTKILDISVSQEHVEILLTVESPKWEDTEIFRFYRSNGSVGELFIRDFHARVGDSKADRGLCFTAGQYSEDAKKYAEGRPIDLIDKTGLIKLLKKVDIS